MSVQHRVMAQGGVGHRMVVGEGCRGFGSTPPTRAANGHPVERKDGKARLVEGGQAQRAAKTDLAVGLGFGRMSPVAEAVDSFDPCQGATGGHLSANYRSQSS